MFNRLTNTLYATRARAVATVLFWVVVTGLLSALAPSLASVQDNSTANLPPAASDSMQARKLVRATFPDQAALPAVIVVRAAHGDAHAADAAVRRISAALQGDSRPKGVVGVVSSATNPRAAAEFTSADRDTQLLVVPIAGDPTDDAFVDAVVAVRKLSGASADGVTVKVAGPAGIAADAVKVFSSADLTLLFGTIALVLVLLLVIYRSPLMALVPLIAVFFAMRISQGAGALMADAGWISVDAQAASIMTVLLFGVGTDYALIISARYREELAAHTDRYHAMHAAMRAVGETITSSAATIVLTMFALLVAVSPTLRGFGPYFALGVTVMTLVSFTFIPAVLLLLGRSVFWPARIARTAQGSRLWQYVANVVIGAPRRVIAITAVALAALSLGIVAYHGTFDLVSGFRITTQSAQGRDIIRDEFGPGRVAPTNVVIRAAHPLSETKLAHVATDLDSVGGVAHVDQRPQLSADQRVALFSVVLDHDPYSSAALDAMPRLERAADRAVRDAGIRDATVLLGGETAQTSDIRAALDRDTGYVVGLVLLIVFATLAVLLRSLLAPIYLVATLMLSFIATIGATTFVTITLLGDAGIGNRVAIYIFVFLVALGVDYNIFIMSRFKEELQRRTPRDAIRTAITTTGGVVSSAGLILAGTFSVLMTQPIRELFQFGFGMAFGILLDTFIIRPLLVPAIVTMLDRRALWPSRPPVIDS